MESLRPKCPYIYANILIGAFVMGLCFENQRLIKLVLSANIHAIVHPELRMEGMTKEWVLILSIRNKIRFVCFCTPIQKFINIVNWLC